MMAEDPGLIIDNRFGMEMVLILNGRKVRHHAAERLVALPVRRHIPAGDYLAVLDDPQFLCHQPEQQINVASLLQQEEKLGFLKRCQDPLGELLSFDGRDTEGGIFRHAPAENRHERPTGISRECRCGAGADSEIKCGGDVRNAGEVNRLMQVGAGDVDEQLFGDGVRDCFIIARHGTIQRARRKAARHGQAAQDSCRDHSCKRSC